jgi:xanthine dehydrogenase YagS FAD-binding subunit
MRPFEYTRASDPGQAVAIMRDHPEARFLGGGTNLVDLMRLGVESPDLLIDVNDVTGDRIDADSDGGLRIGAAVSNSDLAAHPDVRRRFPAISQAILAGASGQLRNMATLGGNLMQRTRCMYFTDPAKPCNKRAPGTGCPARDGEHHNLAVLGASAHCVATHPSDLAVALAALDAVVTVHDTGGPREIPLADFYLPVGDSPHREVTIAAGTLITGVRVPPLPMAAGSRYHKVRERASYAFAIGSIAACAQVGDGTVTDVRIALGAVASMPWRARHAEQALIGAPATVDSFAAAADAELANARPLRDNGYKIPLIHTLIVRTLTELTTPAGADRPLPGAAR